MFRFMRQSLLVQMLGVYLLFVVVVLGAGMGVNAGVEQHLRDDVQASDQALAQEVAVATSLKLADAKSSLDKLSQSAAVRAGTPAAMASAFQVFRAARADVDHVYWLDSLGVLLVSEPPQTTELVREFEPPDIVQRARNALSGTQVIEVGVAELKTFTPGVIIAEPVRDSNKNLLGIVATSITLDDLSKPLEKVVGAQASQHRQLMISIIDNRGELIATPDSKRFLLMVLNELPGADQALQGHPATLLGPGPGGQEWLYSAVPIFIDDGNWAVVVQRPASEALAVVEQFHLWLLSAALLFGLGGLVFWLVLLGRVIRPLHALALRHRALPTGGALAPSLDAASGTAPLAERADEVGGLARSLQRLESDVLTQLAELRTLLETSNAVVGSLDPRAVVGTIIRAARRLVHVQAAAVLVPDEQDVLRVLVSDGHGEHYDHGVSLAPEHPSSAAVAALRDGRPVQKILSADQPYPSFSFQEGFRAVLAIPIISRHAGGVVLLVHRTEPRPFSENEVDLLLTFANYATLAWEHAVLYERSDERLREIAQENERLYRTAAQEKQTLAAIMGSMSDGLVLTGIDGTVLYANPGASAIAGLPSAALERSHIRGLYAALGEWAEDRAECEAAIAIIEAGPTAEQVIELRREGQHRAIHLRLFDVGDELGQAIGRGLLLRDVTRERELDELKSTLLAAVGHELRTPLAAIKGHASTLLQEDVTWPVADQRHFLQTITNEADRLARLVSNLLDLSRMEAGLLLLTRTPARLEDLLTHAMQRLGDPGASLVVEIPDTLPPLDVDGARVEVVLQNLLANALAYGGGAVHISAAQRGEVAVIAIRDDGPGIALDELSHVFERFYRARHGREQRSGGTGLGLAICKAFVEAHGGVIWADSGQAGTTISFSLPLVAEAGAGAPAADAVAGPLEMMKNGAAHDDEVKAYPDRRG